VTPEIFRELWVRGPDRHWYRYLVLPDSIEVLEDDDDDEDPGAGVALPPPPVFVPYYPRARRFPGVVSG
jgi:hypothetical protein